MQCAESLTVDINKEMRQGKPSTETMIREALQAVSHVPEGPARAY